MTSVEMWRRACLQSQVRSQTRRGEMSDRLRPQGSQWALVLALLALCAVGLAIYWLAWAAV